MQVGVFAIRRHYYEPQFDNRHPRLPYSSDRALPGIDMNASEQLATMEKFAFAEELEGIPVAGRGTPGTFHMNNGSFCSGDAEYWYQLIRAFKPQRIFEIGSGYSTLMAIKAIARNRNDDANYQCEHVCIEPYEKPWLEQTGVRVIRKKVEDVGTGFFKELRDNDVLFIDSSHVIRPQGDVVFEYLELLPSLQDGVIAHIHDIFTPRNYLREWMEDEVLFWNEQYLLEAFLTHNSSWRIIGALNYLHHNHFEKLRVVAPYLEPQREPGSFYIRKAS